MDQQNSINFHYFRLKAHRWELYLSRAVQLGYTTLFSPVPWFFHAPTRPLIDLQGAVSAERNVGRWLQQCQALNLQTVLSVTPPFGGLLNDGMPAWLTMPADGAPIQPDSVAGRQVVRWFKALAKIVTPNTTLIIPKTSPATLPPYAVTVQWPIWLRKRYDGIAALNETYQPETAFKHVNEVEPDQHSTNPALQTDLRAFSLWHSEQIAGQYLTLAQAAGLTVTTWDKPLPQTHIAVIDSTNPRFSQSLTFGPDAPLYNNARPTYHFFKRKVQSAKSLDPDGNHLRYVLPGEPTTLIIPHPQQVVRLLLSGQLDRVRLKKGETSDELTYVCHDEMGETDAYLVSDDFEKPLSVELQSYLGQLLTAQYLAIDSARQALKRLIHGLNYKEHAPSPAPATQQLNSAQEALNNAYDALQKAAASVGALEDAFVTMLDKPQQAPLGLPLSALEEPLKSTMLAQLEAANTNLGGITPPVQPTTLAQYHQSYNHLIKTAETALTPLQQALATIRQGLASQTVAPVGWRVQYPLQTIMLTLNAGVLRQ